eukprot:2953835-Rhodomonas_salina.2
MEWESQERRSAPKQNGHADPSKSFWAGKPVEDSEASNLLARTGSPVTVRSASPNPEQLEDRQHDPEFRHAAGELAPESLSIAGCVLCACCCARCALRAGCFCARPATSSVRGVVRLPCACTHPLSRVRPRGCWLGAKMPSRPTTASLDLHTHTHALAADSWASQVVGPEHAGQAAASAGGGNELLQPRAPLHRPDAAAGGGREQQQPRARFDPAIRRDRGVCGGVQLRDVGAEQPGQLAAAVERGRVAPQRQHGQPLERALLPADPRAHSRDAPPPPPPSSLLPPCRRASSFPSFLPCAFLSFSSFCLSRPLTCCASVRGQDYSVYRRQDSDVEGRVVHGDDDLQVSPILHPSPFFPVNFASFRGSGLGFRVMG